MAGDVIAMKDLMVSPRGDIMDYNFFNKRFLELTAAINGLAARQDSFDATENTLVQTGLDRVNQVLGPLLIQLQLAAQLGFLVADAIGPMVSLQLNVDTQFTVTSEGKSLFTPTPYVLAQDKTQPNNWGILSTTSYQPANGVYAGHCVYAALNQGSTQWTLSCNSALPSAMMALAAQAQTAADAATAANDSVEGQIGDLNALVALVQSGPVASVAGKGGAVILNTADITGLDDALASKATTAALAGGLTTKQNTSAILGALAALTLFADRLIYATGSATFNVTPFTAFARSLLAGADAPTARSTLGLGDAALQPSSAFQPAFGTLPSGQIAGQVTPDQVVAHVFVSSENGKVIAINVASAVTATLQADLAVGWNALVYQKGPGQITFVGNGATLRNRQNQFKTAGQFAVVSVVCVGTGEYVIGGDTAP
jgi:hypothetical protein